MWTQEFCTLMRGAGRSLAALAVVLAGMASLPVGAADAKPLIVTIPAPESAADRRFGDVIELLGRALENTRREYGDYRVVETPIVMNEARYLSELRSGSGSVNLVWSSTSQEKETALLPVRIPLRKGLLGYRIALIERSRTDAFKNVRTRADLQKLVVGQGIGWGDIAVYNANGIRVTTAAYDQLFRMVSAGRFDLFPRGVNEVFGEFEARAPTLPELAIEPHIAIYYPWPYYFFVNRADESLARRIEIGLRRMIDSGEFDQIFQRYHGPAIARARLSSRTIIPIDNPLLPPETPLSEKRLWWP